MSSESESEEEELDNEDNEDDDEDDADDEESAISVSSQSADCPFGFISNTPSPRFYCGAITVGSDKNKTRFIENVNMIPHRQKQWHIPIRCIAPSCPPVVPYQRFAGLFLFVDSISCWRPPFGVGTLGRGRVLGESVT